MSKYKKGLMREYYSMELSELAFITDFNALEKRLEKIGFYLRDKSDMFSFDEMDGFVATCEDGQVLVFRGSEFEPENLFKDWRINLDFKLIDINIEGVIIPNVASGFGKRIERYWGQLKDLIWDDDPLTTGYSAGGGYCTIFARAFKDVMKKPVVKCVAHASPRITNTHKFLPERKYTINCSDLVPRVPLRLQERRHTGTMVYYNKSGHYTPKAKVEKIIEFFFNIKQSIPFHMPTGYKNNWYNNWDEIEQNF
jgi:hypothetical protein